MDFKRFMDDIGLVTEIRRERCYKNFVAQSTYTSSTYGLERLTRQECPASQTPMKEIDFCLVGNSLFLKYVKVIIGELQHYPVVVDVDKKQIKKAGWKTEGEKVNVAKLRDEPTDRYLSVWLKKLSLITNIIY